MNIKRNISGILLLDKAPGITSNTALQQVKRLFQAEKAGHTGSLDPMATGLLPICLGEATKFSQYLLEENKEYEFILSLGVKTETGDAEGKVIETAAVPAITLENIKRICAQFLGESLQVPSAFSALKFQGQPLYKLARKGQKIEKDARKITIFSLDLVSTEQVQTDLLRNEIALRARVSKGTYIRNLAEDLGQALGTLAHVSKLRRIAVGHFTAAQMITFEALQRINHDAPETLDALLLPIQACLQNFPILPISEPAFYYLKQGQSLMLPYSPKNGWVNLILKTTQQFVGLGEVLANGFVAPRRLIKNEET